MPATPRRHERLIRAVVSVLGGALLCTAFPGLGLWWVAPVALAMLTLATVGAGTRRGAWLGLLFGLAFFGPTLHWAGTYVGAVPWIGLTVLQSLYAAVTGALIGGLTRPGSGSWGRRWSSGPSLALLTGLAWVTGEFLRSRTPYGGFPWVRVAFSQPDGPLVRWAAVAGAPMVTFVVAALGGVLAALVLHLPGRRLRPADLATLAAATLVAVGGAFLVPAHTDGPTVSVLGVQGNVPRAGLDFNTERRMVLDNHARATRTAAQQVASGQRQRPDLVVWPENSSDIDPMLNTDAGQVIREAVSAIGAPTLVGTLSEEPRDALYNLTYLYLPGQGPTQPYIKRHPVPFAEYIPNKDFFRTFSSAVDLVPRPYLPGDRVGVFTLPDGTREGLRPGTLICFEVAYDDLSRELVTSGANLVVVQTNNATFGFTQESAQQLAISRVRAVELGRSVAHVSTVGESALITPDGVAHQRTSLFTQAVIQQGLPLRTDRTLAVRVGEWPERLALFAVLGLVSGTIVTTRARGRAAPGRSAGDRVAAKEEPEETE